MTAIGNLFVANGNESRKTAKDYCTRFWCHDIYTGNSRENRGLDQFFKTNLQLNFGQKGMSWNGFEHNTLLMNQQGKGFLSVAFLAGVASEFDSRNVISDDFNGDGRVDLAVLERPDQGMLPAIHIFQNKFASKSNWIGIRMEGTKRSALGARVAVTTAERIHIAAVVAGDSYASQHAPVAHFGLGNSTEVKQIEIRWPDGETIRIPKPAINQYHRVGSAKTAKTPSG